MIRRDRWGAYNARSMTPDEVAATFIPHDFFFSLTSADHHLIVGPRGSGKTTLLKMLHPRGLAAWRNPEASKVRASMPFMGVFIPADRTWSAQIHALDDASPPGQPKYSEAAFAVHVMRSLVRTMLDRVEMPEGPTTEFARMELSKHDQAELVDRLTEIWMLPPGVPSLRGLRQQLTQRLSVLWRMARARSRGKHLSEEQPAWLDFDYMQEAIGAIELFNDYAHQEDTRWAFLFDELELAPPGIRSELVTDIRLPDPRVVLKLALTPYPDVPVESRGPEAPTPDNDYKVIPLSYADRTELSHFSKHLLSAWLKNNEWTGPSLERMLGPSRVDTPAAEWLATGNAYKEGSARHRQLMEYVRHDQSVLRYLQKQGIDLEDIGGVTPKKRAAVLRKIAPLVALREHYLKGQPDSSGRRKRTRKTFEFYTGLSHVLALAESNPRALFNLMGPMLAQVDPRTGEIPEHVQAQAIEEAVARYRSFLRTIAVPGLGTSSQEGAPGSRRGLLDMLDRIGSYFADATLGRRFNPDPPGTVLVDSTIGGDHLISVAAALNAGALVFVPDRDSQVELISQVRGKRFRFNYLLSAYYHLPLRKGRPISLSAVLHAPDGQPHLFTNGDAEDGLENG